MCTETITSNLFVSTTFAVHVNITHKVKSKRGVLTNKVDALL